MRDLSHCVAVAIKFDNVHRSLSAADANTQTVLIYRRLGDFGFERCKQHRKSQTDHLVIRSIMSPGSIFECTTGILCREKSLDFSWGRSPPPPPHPTAFRLLYRPAQLLTVSPSNTLHGEALVSVLKPRAWVQGKKGKKKGKEKKAATKMDDKARPDKQKRAAGHINGGE